MAKKTERPIWLQFMDAYNSGDLKTCKAMHKAESDPDRKESMRRALYGPTASQRRESADRQAWLKANEKRLEKMARVHCQFEGLPKLGKK